MPAVVEPSKLVDHPAVRAWRAIHPALPPRGLEIWKRGTRRKATVFRLAFLDSAPRAVFAKRGPRRLLRVERALHERILPALPVPTPRLLGYREAAGGDAWLFVEDLGDRSVDPRRPEETRLVGDWLGRMHAAAAEDGNGARLPDAGPARYRGHLQRARERIQSHLGNPALTAADVALLASLLRQLDLVESHWEPLQRACEGIPPTLVHGDFQSKNLRLRERDGRLELVPIDWEMAGWGVPVVDLADAPTPNVEHQVDLAAYQRAVRDRWPDLSLDDLRRLAAVGYVLRRLAAVDWEAASLRFPVRPNVIKALSCLPIYQAQVADGLRRLAPWLG